ncbi:MAG: hypothetical protein LBD80_06220 [Tannerella sp.]|jgi:DNA gyrase/topoisomerase IV subunit B|nr:hypothetical protein [Tannerella sp.]
MSTEDLELIDDADVNGMHMFRVRSKKETVYCYHEEEKAKAMNKLGAHPEITRFKGLGEISPDEFRSFIDENIRLEGRGTGTYINAVKQLYYEQYPKTCTYH